MGFSSDVTEHKHDAHWFKRFLQQKDEQNEVQRHLNIQGLLLQTPEPTLIFMLIVMIFFEYLQILNMLTATKYTSIKTIKLTFLFISRSNNCINDLSTTDFSKCQKSTSRHYGFLFSVGTITAFFLPKFMIKFIHTRRPCLTLFAEHLYVVICGAASRIYFILGLQTVVGAADIIFIELQCSFIRC